ncbi:exopolysaccharide biosynthesis polyprenyl glycosylphosphotransferase [Nonomuraea typhae]|uniref:exopolysaccharide biosynthesis polyprenyl glycosylphosphotransferase n=1 Tax=Nonomuraea typhae TaxID=2603600 RepID=UPI0012FC546D|nr:exopolysaccharide biosynthesis polyprenyl glycosylphosphotransferase [Nonomuraea typhae]
MAVAVGTSEPTDDVLESELAPAPRAPHSSGLLRGLARLAGALSRETVCLLTAVAVTGWAPANPCAAVAITVLLQTALRTGRTTALASVPRSLVVALSALMVEAWACAPAPAPPSAAWLATGATYTALIYLVHLVRQAATHLAARRRAPREAVILSSGEHGRKLARTLLQHPEYGLKPIGMIGDGTATDGELPLLATYSTCVKTLRQAAVRTVIVAGRPPITRATLQQIRDGGCEVLLAPAPDDLIQDFAHRPGQQLHSHPLLPMRPPAQRRPYWIVKRAADAVLAGIALLVLSPLVGLCLLGARIEGGPGVLFRQRRVGMGGRLFDMLKIRTLKPASAHDSATRWTVTEARLSGPFGGFLRKTSLDELPQLWNVITGDMSIVGPRPERPFFVEQFSRQIEQYDRRHRVPVGITGWAQVHGLRGDTSIEERARLDNYYIDEWSLKLDVKIVARTVGCVLRLGGA